MPLHYHMIPAQQEVLLQQVLLQLLQSMLAAGQGSRSPQQACPVPQPYLPALCC